MKRFFWVFVLCNILFLIPFLCQASVIVLSNNYHDYTLTPGSDVKIYGTSESNHIILPSGVKAELLNFPGQNSIQIQSSSSLFMVSRSGAVVIFEGFDGTMLKISATASIQTIAFTDQTLILRIHDNVVMLDDQVVVTEKSSVPQTRHFEEGLAMRTETGKYWLLDLSGSWLEMGRQYGGLMRTELQQFHTDLISDLEARGMDEASRTTVGKEVYNVYSEQLQDLLLGISQTSGLSLDQTLVLNAGMMLLAQAALGGEPPEACSGIAVWDGYTLDGKLIFGRNWDIDRQTMRDYMRYLAVTIFHPLEGYAFANIHPLGNVYLETGMNSEGLFIELNNGEYSDPSFFDDREDTSSVLVSVLNLKSNVQQAADMLASIPADISYILQIADPGQAVTMERPTFDARIRDVDDHGLVVAYNSFVPPYPASWENYVTPPKPAAHDPRYENMIQLAQSPIYMGQFTPEKMQKYLEIPIEEGGAYHSGTVIQVVAVPEERDIWIRGCDYAGWEKISLDNYFNRPR